MAGETTMECTVGDVAAPSRNALVGGPFGSDLVSRDYVPTGVPVIRGANMGHGRWVDGEFVYVTPEKADSLASNCAKPGDLVFTQRGTLGQVALVPKKGVDRYLISQSQMKVTLDPTKADGLFLYYVFISPEQQAYIIQNAITTGVPHTNLGILRNTPLTLPPLAEQKAIAAVLGALDDKIELNRRMNATLEAMARALFQSWFVDFDPVRAKLDGRQPVGIDPATATLFSAAFQDSEAGQIPSGWRVCNLGSLSDYLSRGIGPSYLEEGGVCVLNQKCVRDHRVDFSKSRRHDSTKKPVNGRALQLRDVLVNSTGMGTLGRVAQLFHLPETTIVDSHLTVVRANLKTDSLFLGMNLTGREDEIEELGEGSTGQTELSRTRLGDLKVLAPPLELQNAFGTAIGPFLLRISENEAQSRTLATLRDTLLPKLLSGELIVSKIPAST